MNQRDLELLSAYLDGQLKPSDSARLESRIKSDPQLASVLHDLSDTRSLLRKLPARKAPRNFTLTRKMVGQNPPMPRAYPIFRFATALATLLFVFSLGLNSFGRQLASPASQFGLGGSGGGGAEESAPFAAEALAATEAPAVEPSADLAPPAATVIPTQEAADALRTAQTATAKVDAAGNAAASDQFQAPTPAPLIPSTWQTGLAIIAAVGLLLMFLIRRRMMSRWR